MSKKSRIPEISDEKLRELAEHIKPVVRMVRARWKSKKQPDGSVAIWLEPSPKAKPIPAEFGGGKLFFIKPVDLKTVAFTWDPKAIKEARGLQKFKVITTYHTYGYYGMFKPSIAEVLAQIPQELTNQIVAFEVKGPDTADDLNKHTVELNEGYHVAETTLYTK